MHDDLLDLLSALDGVRQDPRHHPEGDALYHSLQAFELARRDTDDRALWAAALLHDVGKALGSADHAETGADLLDGLVGPRIVWLVRHHLDLLEQPGVTKRRLRGTARLADLQRLRRWDVGGRSPHARVPAPEVALAHLLDAGADALLGHDEQEAE
jgi:exopolyphosphatase/pppGpp-phosphohydrolase